MVHGDGTYDELNFGGVAASKELARHIQCCFDAHGDPDHVSWSDPHLDSGIRRAGDTLAAFLRWYSDWEIEVTQEMQLARLSAGGQVWWYDGGTGDVVVAPGSTVQPLRAGKAGSGRADEDRFARTRWNKGRREAPAAGKMTSLLARTLGPPAAVRRVSWFLVSVRRCLALLPNVLISFLKYLMTARP